MAVSEFAPGLQKTKDKRVYTAIGFTTPILKSGNRLALASKQPIPWRRWMARCAACHYTKVEGAKTKPQLHRCPHCDAGQDDNPGFSIFPVVVPSAFRTNYS